LEKEMVDGLLGRDKAFVSGIILGCSVEGTVHFTEEGSSMSGGAKVGGAVDVESGTVKAQIGGHAKSSKGAFTLMQAVKQYGGPHLDTGKVEGQYMKDSMAFINRWKEQAKTMPKTWKVIAIEVYEPSEASLPHDAMTVPHLVVLGEQGVGKSTLLNAIYGGKRDDVNQYFFKASDSSKSCTQRVHTECWEVDYDSSRLRVKLTDVPGFGDPRRKNGDTMQQLIQHLSSNDNWWVHGIILAHDWNNPRLSQTTLKAFEVLDKQFGDAFWDFLIIVFTKFQLPRAEDYEEAAGFAVEKRDRRIIEWKTSLYAQYPGAQRAWGASSNMFFFIDSEAVLKTDTEIRTMMQTTKGSAAGDGEHVKNSKEYSQAEIISMFRIVKNRVDLTQGVNFVGGTTVDLRKGSAQHSEPAKSSPHAGPTGTSEYPDPARGSAKPDGRAPPLWSTPVVHSESAKPDGRAPPLWSTPGMHSEPAKPDGRAPPLTTTPVRRSEVCAA
jgi:GTP-binding protein EngB required for normal cell division